MCVCLNVRGRQKKMRGNALCAIDSTSCKGKNVIFTLCLRVGTPFFDPGESLTLAIYNRRYAGNGTYLEKPNVTTLHGIRLQ